ncbi:MAG: cobalamin-dependent protein, partial [bacterium]
MKVALISPYEHLASYGIRMLAACLKEAGHECKTLFLTQDFDARYTDEMLKDILEVLEPFPLIGMGVVTNHVHQVMQLSKAIRATYPEKKIIWGGIHATIEPDECLQSADMVCIGEGEEAMVELCNKMDSDADCTDVPNINFKIGDKIIKNAARPLVRDLDSFPFPDYDLDDHYVLDRGRLRHMTAEFLNQNLGGQYVTMSSRGCTYKCTFCCNNVYIELYKGDRWFRKRSNENIVAELRMVKDKMPYIKEIYFDDDAFLARSVRETQEFCDFYAREIALPFIVTGITPTSITEEKLEL